MARVRGNDLFAAGDYHGAIAAYTLGLDGGPTSQTVSGEDDRGTSSSPPSSHSPSERAVLLANRAACHLRLGATDAAAADCQASTVLDPCYFKAWTRLAQCLPVDDLRAGIAICSGGALGSRSGWDQVWTLYRSIQTHHQSWMPKDLEKIAIVSSDYQLVAALAAASVSRQAGGDDEGEGSKEGVVIVLRPGSYNMMPMTTTRLSSCCAGKSLALIGLGNVELVSPISHAIALDGENCSLLIANVQMAGSSQVSAVCVSSNARLRLINCRIHDYAEAGVLIAGGHAELSHCSFRRTAKQAIEVREGGTLHAESISIVDCMQGVTAYGGARRVCIKNSRIEGSMMENVVAAGTFENAPTAMQRETGFGGYKNETSAAAALWGKERAIQLELVLSGCTIARSGQFGLSADFGAVVTLNQCRFDNCDMPAVFVKGGTDVWIRACQFVYRGGKSTQTWGGHRLPQCAVYVAINYGGVVDIYGNAFAGPRELAVFQDAKDSPEWRENRLIINVMGLWSRPANVRDNRHFTLAEADRLPSTSVLAGEGQLLLAEGKQAAESSGHGGARVRAPDIRTQRRLHHTAQLAQWDPLSHAYYAIGNTFGYDLTAPSDGFGSPTTRHQSAAAMTAGGEEVGGVGDGVAQRRLLFAACGDIRNLLATARSVEFRVAASRRETARSGGTHYVLNDGNVSMLARSAVLIHMAAELGATADVVLAVWANHGLTDLQAAMLSRSLSLLAVQPWPTWLSAASSLDPDAPADARAEASLRAVFRAWADCTMSLSELLEVRNALLLGVVDHAIDLSIAATGGRFRQDVSAYLRTGSIDRQRSSSCGSSSPGSSSRRSRRRSGRSSDAPSSSEPLTSANVTLLLAPALQYTVYFSSSIFRAVPLDAACSTALEGLLTWITPGITCLASALRSGTASLQLVPGDILDLMTSPREVTSGTHSRSPCQPLHNGHHDDCNYLYDFIDCSNVADYVSVPALLQAAAPFLARRPSSRLRIESKVLLHEARARLGGPHLDPGPVQFVESQLPEGFSLASYETLLGIRLLGGNRLQLTNEVKPAGGKNAAPAAKAAAEAAAAAAAAGGIRLEIAAASADTPTLPHSRMCGISALFLLLELLRACKNSMPSSTTLVHLLAMASSDNDPEPMVQALLRCDPEGQAPMFKWELLLHAKVQAAFSRANPPLSPSTSPPSTIIDNLRLLLVTYDASPGFALLRHRDSPLLLAFSRQPLPSGVVMKRSAAQLMSVFEWVDDVAKARFLITASVLKQCRSWFVTLCVLSASAGLVAVGIPAALSSLTVAPVSASEIRPWRCHSDPRASALLSPDERETLGLEHLSFSRDMDMIDKMFSVNDRKEWQHAIHFFAECIVVDVLAPGELPAVEHAKVSVLVDGKFLAVDIIPAKGRKGGGGGGGGGGGKNVAGGGGREGASTSVSPDSFRVPLPCEVSKDNDACKIMISRRLGAISARILKIPKSVQAAKKSSD
ncbi:hypothetical protein CBR_g41659 [Chara braunii]|uniref:Uncharacterized protein n=1 Tax=Chara braunii TaxID=69332 RepID=A0A388LW99_CHABU|nr:hypothetical protein CBR_g41659 [Chara braunii]|eukprot:GBG86594.1 hypothetical protein CBR_g41659 [Chara braunii]